MSPWAKNYWIWYYDCTCLAEWQRLMKSYCTNQGRSVEDTVINNAMIWPEPGRDVKVAREQASRLTGYNVTYSDRSFLDKKSIAHGFNESPIRINRFIREQETWTAVEIKTRGEQLAAKALKIWQPLVVDPVAIQQAELADHIAAPEKYSIDTIEWTAAAKALFDPIRPQIQALGSDINELPNSRSIIYRVFDFVVEVLPSVPTDSKLTTRADCALTSVCRVAAAVANSRSA